MFQQAKWIGVSREEIEKKQIYQGDMRKVRVFSLCFHAECGRDRNGAAAFGVGYYSQFPLSFLAQRNSSAVRTMQG